MEVMTMSVLEGYVSKPELAAQLQKSTRTLDRLERQRIGPPRTVIGRLILYKVDSVKEWLNGQEQRRNRTRGAR
jgi:predicted DNA-binding transcriptional regulator AlpA